MNDAYRKILSLLLALCMILCMVACQPDAGDDLPEPPPEDDPTVTPPEDDPTDNPPIEEPEPTEIELSAKYVLIRPDEKNDTEVKAALLLERALESIYGEKFNIATDYPAKGEDDEDTFEILIGETNREATQTVLATLSYKDWTYSVVNSKTIVICGGCPEATYDAVCGFLRDVLGYTEDAQTGEVVTPGEAKVLSVGASSSYQHQYPITSLMLGSHEFSEYSIVTSAKTSAKKGAQELVDHFLELTGIELPIVSLNAYKKGEGGPAIFLGCTGVDDKHVAADPYSMDRYYIYAEGDHIILDFKNVNVASTAAKRLAQECARQAKGGDNVTLSIPKNEMLTGLRIPEGTNSLVLDSCEVTSIAPGVSYEARLYYDPNGKPVRTYMITVAQGAGTIATTLPGDREKIGTYDHILDQVLAASANGKKVVAGINADFFEGTMLGLCVREGAELHDVSGRPWFGVTKDGKAVLGVAEEYPNYQGKLMCGVGGSNVVIDNDCVSHISVDHEFGYTRHPRTAVGIKADGSVVFLVVDGRQPTISNGASLADVADILGSVGCIEALNLDGGGSSTFVLTDGKGGFTVTNSPSDGSLREVADGLMVILP